MKYLERTAYAVKLILFIFVCLLAVAAVENPEEKEHDGQGLRPEEPETEEFSAENVADPAVGVAVEGAEPVLEATVPQRWLPDRGRECRRYRRRRVCNGPRKVPEPVGPAAELARQLGLGDRHTTNQLLHYGPDRSWVEVVEGADPTEFEWAVPGGRLWRGFGFVRRIRRAKRHEGVDIGAPAGTPIVAVADGLVAYSDNGFQNYGNMIVILHADGAVTLYAHCRANYVFAGQQVTAGQVIGEVGDTGLARGAHLHFEWHVNGQARDPLPLFLASATGQEALGVPTVATRGGAASSGMSGAK